MDLLLTMLAGALLFEGLLPLLIPKQWQQLLQAIVKTPTPQIRRIGGVLVTVAITLLWILIRSE